MKFFRSLLVKYMAIILTAIFLIQITYLISAFFIFNADQNIFHQDKKTQPVEIEKNWHTEANAMQRVTAETVMQHFDKWHESYPSASMFWVDQNGRLNAQSAVKEDLPEEWTSVYTAKYIKERYEGDPFTVIAFVGTEQQEGFIVLELPRKELEQPGGQKYGNLILIIAAAIIILFIVVSFLFFRGIRKRLLHLQEAMEVRDVDGLPIQINVKKMDEIGQLQQSFNVMVGELRASKEREREEEQLRRELIANLSHDLRTPLTKLLAHTYSIAKEEMSLEGKKSIKIMVESINRVDRLIENLMSYTLLVASKYKYEPKEKDIIRFVRESLASWYPVFEKEEFKIDIQLTPFKEKEWMIDPMWLGRVFDNLFQNVVRHAKTGAYVGVSTESTTEYDAIIVSDHGPGMANSSKESGAGIGLSIIDMMVKGMKLEWEIQSSERGTIVKIKRNKKGEPGEKN
ncbi:histidine kinase dimerization/phospho-acceptor domain-containing protein [Neobacillus sp. K501]